MKLQDLPHILLHTIIILSYGSDIYTNADISLVFPSLGNTILKVQECVELWEESQHQLVVASVFPSDKKQVMAAAKKIYSKYMYTVW